MSSEGSSLLEDSYHSTAVTLIVLYLWKLDCVSVFMIIYSETAFASKKAV